MNACVLVPAGSFVMGSAEGRGDERPAHRVHLRAFEFGVHQVTNAEYAQYVQATHCAAPPFWSDPALCDPGQPVVGVSWFEAASYCEWLGARCRLPSEAEWEYAARAGVEGNEYPWGSAPPQSHPQYAERWLAGPERVAQQEPNAFGVHDLCENVHEWCSDWYDAAYYASSPSRDPRGPAEGTRRASRGGSWRHQIKISRCAARSSLPPQLQYADYGFRIARDIESV